MVVKQKNGENWRINVNEVEEIIFDESIPEDSAIVDTSVTPLKFKILSDSTVEVINDDSYREDAFPESITIPAKVRIEGKIYNVISIGDYAFRDCNGLISIKIPNSVSSIGNYAFSGYSNLDVTIDNSKDNITLGYDVFYLCKSVTYPK
ncbi:MAG: leucine-rich repeat protein [Paludibacteraceae bacterium]|nr:leucine-rich repeat protein [Paludibacteraceae bacterium]